VKTGFASKAKLCNGLSRMRGNPHVRFLGEELAAMPTPYPTGYFSDLYLIHHNLMKMERLWMS